VIQQENNDACNDCVHVRDGPYCVPMCPREKYADEKGVCQDCHENCEDNGCTGPVNGVGPGACNSCAIAIFDTNAVNVTSCLSSESSCETGFFEETLTKPAIAELKGMQV